MTGPTALMPTGWAGRLDPDGSQARRWLEEELAKPEYQDGRSLLERVLQWIRDRFDGLQIDPGSSPGLSIPPLASAALAALVVVGIALLLTRVRRERRHRTPRDPVLGGLDLSAEEFRRRGEQAMREGRYGDAVVEYTRALARESADRTLLADAPSSTAHEIGTQLSAVFPPQTSALHRTTDLFDRVLYGRYDASAADARLARQTEESVRRARPRLPADAVEEAADGGGAPAGRGVS